MRNLIAAFYFLLALFGCEGVGTTIVTRSATNGVDAIHSRIHLLAGVARFECLASATGECHYTLFPDKCASSDRDCTKRPIDRFALPKGERREIVGLPAFDTCVAPDGSERKADCSTVRGRTAAN